MATLKCKMCGGSLILIDGSTVAECEFCGSRQTVPFIDNDKKQKLYDRANRLRFNCDFDKAAGVYESIVNEFPEDAESYWGLILCKYGIEYVDDPATGRKIPTCHRSSFDSVMDDPDFEMVMENADSTARKLYREEAKQIEELRKSILEVSGKEEPYDIFICYKETDDFKDRTIDSVIAQDVYDALTNRGYRVFFSRISLEDKLGTEYEPYIFAALNSAKIMLAFGTSYDNYNAVWVKNEWSRFLKLMSEDREKHLIPCFKNVDAYDMPKEFQHLQALDMGKVGAVQDLLRGIDKILRPERLQNSTGAAQPVQQVISSGGINLDALMKRGKLALEAGEWENARKFHDQVLNMNAEEAEAYLGLFLANNKLQSIEIIAGIDDTAWINSLKNDVNLRRYLAFAVRDGKERIESVFRTADEKAAVRRKREDEANAAAKIKADEARTRAEEAERSRLKQLAFLRDRNRPAQNMVALAGETIIGIPLNGKPVFSNAPEWMENNLKKWSGIKQIAYAAPNFTGVLMGLKTDGRVVLCTDTQGPDAQLWNNNDFSGWKDIVSISGNEGVFTGLSGNGGIVSVATNRYFGIKQTENWTGMRKICISGRFIAGLSRDGTVKVHDLLGIDLFSSDPDWKDIVDIAIMGTSDIAGLSSDGKVHIRQTAGEITVNEEGWDNITAIAGGFMILAGLNADGTVKVYNAEKLKKQPYYSQKLDPSGWTDIVAVKVTGMGLDEYIVGVRSDGTVVSTDGRDLSGWKLFPDIRTLDREIAADREKARNSLLAERESLQKELAGLKGLFTGRRRAAIEARLAEIEEML
ncbi:MAG: toll/interleukin-1 receptor domain-containing protein [Eubacterium sp.]|nr:toll/interleukin-1 receptor domain-containing protein [Eubacterium sp.]